LTCADQHRCGHCRRRHQVSTRLVGGLLHIRTLVSVKGPTCTITSPSRTRMVATFDDGSNGWHCSSTARECTSYRRSSIARGISPGTTSIETDQIKKPHATLLSISHEPHT
jgi:hypothetical protein